MRRRREMKRREKRRLRRLKLRTLFMLSITLIFNAYAWFLYVTTVSSNMTVHVESWSVNFSVDDEAVEKEILFDVSAAYPGMAPINRTVKVSNNGEKVADVKYVITKARILDTVYIATDELDLEEQENLTGREIEKTAAELVEMLENDFPFKVILTCSSYSLATGQEATVSLDFQWPYDTVDANGQEVEDAGKDEEDTKYGVGSYEYYDEYGNYQPAMQIKVKLIVKQHKGS